MEYIDNLLLRADKPFEFGVEQEFLFEIKHNNKKFNFNISEIVHKLIYKYRREVFSLKKNTKIGRALDKGWRAIPEYSKCLIEITSPPVEYNKIPEVTSTLEEFKAYLGEFLHSFFKEFNANLFDKILSNNDTSLLFKNSKVFLSNNGTSETNLYMNLDGSIIKDDINNSYLVLKNNAQLFEELSKLNIKTEVGSYMEKGIGIYNHLNSLHLTFHPNYTSGDQSNVIKYYTFLHLLPRMIKKYKIFDQGNKTIKRDNKLYCASRSVRDIFLESLNKIRYGNKIPIKYPSSENTFDLKNTQAQLTNLYNNLIKFYSLKKNEDFDTVFEKWSSISFRPRVSNKVPLIEIRAFGSNLKYEQLTKLVRELKETEARL